MRSTNKKFIPNRPGPDSMPKAFCRPLARGPAVLKHTRSLKLKLRVIGDNPKDSWKRIRQITQDSWRAANWIASGQFMNDQLIRRLYARRKIDPKDREAVAEVEEQFKSVFGTKRQATSERDVKKTFPELPPCVTNPLNQIVVSSYKKEKPDMLAGYRSLRSYRRGMPVPTTRASVLFVPDGATHHIIWKVGRKEHIRFEVYYGRDKANNRLTISRILEGTRDYGAPSVQLKDRDLFLLLPVKEPEQTSDLLPDLAVGVDLGIAIPAYVALSKGLPRLALGAAEDFLKTRMQMQSRRRRLQRSLTSACGGHGRKRRMKALDNLGRKERLYARNYNHNLSRRIVDFALRHQAGSIKLEFLEGYGSQGKNNFVLRNWSYYELQTLIREKAVRHNIEIRFVDPYHTSQTCSECGHYESGQRLQRDNFVCLKCGAKIHADYNAALNIARSKLYVTKKEDCQITKDNTDRLGSQPKGEGLWPLTNLNVREDESAALRGQRTPAALHTCARG